MSRVTLIDCISPLTPKLVCDVLGLVAVLVEPHQVAEWTLLERQIAYDWAMREHIGASDHYMRRRTIPSFVVAADRAATRRRAQHD